MTGPLDWIKHVYTLHDGEVRQVGEERWAPFPASGGMLAKACFWQYQFMKKDGAPNEDMLLIFVFEQFKTRILQTGFCFNLSVPFWFPDVVHLVKHM